MRSTLKYIAACLLVVVPLFTFSQLKGKVVGISDGDTFTLLTADRHQIKIRLFGIDAPEKTQDFGQKAKDYLSDLIFFDTVEVITKGVDQYERTLGIVYKHRSNVNERMLQAGYAWHYIHYDTNSSWTMYESQARKLKKGLWQQPNAVAPWEWRYKHKN